MGGTKCFFGIRDHPGFWLREHWLMDDQAPPGEQSRDEA
jgi:hypothetical protein